MAGLPSPTLRTVVLPAEVDVVAVVLVGAVAWSYVRGVRRLAARGRAWPAARSASFLTGLAVIVVATQTGIARYDIALFSAHVLQHILLSMVAPVLLVLGAPLPADISLGDAKVGNTNLGVVLPIWDMLLGTHSDPMRVVVGKTGIQGYQIPGKFLHELTSLFT